MASVNKWIGIGNVVKKPVIRRTQGGTSVVSFSIACNEVFKDKQGNKQEKVEFINLTMWGSLAELAEKYLDKGKQIFVEGKIQNSSYEKDGVKHYKSEVVCNTMQFLGGRSSESSASGESLPSRDINSDVDDSTLPF